MKTILWLSSLANSSTLPIKFLHSMAVVCVLSGVAIAQPAAPDFIQASDGDSLNHVKVEFDLVPQILTYELFRAESYSTAPCAGLKIAHLQNTCLTCETYTHFDISAVAGKTYRYSVRALAFNGSPGACVKNPDIGWKGPPQDTAVTASRGDYDGRVRLLLQPAPTSGFPYPSGNLNYRIYRSTNQNAQGCQSANLIGSLTYPNAILDDWSVQAGVNYYYSALVDGPFDSGCSNISQGHSKMRAATDLVASDGVYTGQIRIAWTAPANTAVSYYRLYRNTSGNPCTGTQSDMITATGYYDNVPAGTNYYYSVATIGANYNIGPCSNVDMGFAKQAASQGSSFSTSSSSSQSSVTSSVRSSSVASSQGPVSSAISSALSSSSVSSSVGSNSSAPVSSSVSSAAPPTPTPLAPTPTATPTTGFHVCSNGLDDDGDGLIDFPSDPGCSSADDSSEDEAAPRGCVEVDISLSKQTSALGAKELQTLASTALRRLETAARRSKPRAAKSLRSSRKRAEARISKASAASVVALSQLPDSVLLCPDSGNCQRVDNSAAIHQHITAVRELRAAISRSLRRSLAKLSNPKQKQTRKVKRLIQQVKASAAKLEAIAETLPAVMSVCFD